MIFREIGQVSGNFYVLGVAHYPIYLLTGRKPILFEAGLTILGRIYRNAIKAVLGKGRPEILFLTHVHYDHCGAASYLTRVFPELIVAGSKRASEIIKRPGAVKLIRTLSQTVEEAVGHLHAKDLLEEPFEPFKIDLILEDGQMISLDEGVSVQAFSTPGHTSDFFSYYVPEYKILIASEAIGCANSSGYILTDCLVDYETYLASLKRLASLEVEILCQGHNFVYLNQDVPDFFRRSIQAALDFKDMVEQSWKVEGRDMRRVVNRIKSLEYDHLPRPKQPESAYIINLEARIKSVLKGL